MRILITSLIAVLGIAGPTLTAFGQYVRPAPITSGYPAGYAQAPAMARVPVMTTVPAQVPSQMTPPLAAPAPGAVQATPTTGRVRATRSEHTDASTSLSSSVAASSAFSGGCADGCNSCSTPNCSHCCTSQCDNGICAHRSGLFAEYLNWQARGADLVYAVPQNGLGGIGTSPRGPLGQLDFDNDGGFRGGFNLALDCCSSITATFTWFETDAHSDSAINAPFVLQPVVLFPGTFNAGTPSQQATADAAIDFQIADVDYRSVLKCGTYYHVNWLAGARFAAIDQTFQVTYPFAPPDGTTSLNTELNFEGAGIRFGLDGERVISRSYGARVYSKAVVSFLAGEMRTSYNQVDQFNGREAFLDVEDDRIITNLDAELGLSWTSPGGMVRVSGGYSFNSWLNLITTPEFIDTVTRSAFVDGNNEDHDALTFDGAVFRLELNL